ncbi:MAG: putative rane protein [Clostridiales bacterium]|jgi:stage III sporulation protein AD|nr:putative rane protein [Clostridiales bacterium]
MNIIQLSIIGIIAVILALQFKTTKPEFSILISIGAMIIIFYFAITKLDIVLSTINRIQTTFKLSDVYLDILIKIIGIAYIAEFATQLCKDAGYGAIASQIEVGAKLSILVVSLPILLSIVDTISALLKF